MKRLFTILLLLLFLSSVFAQDYWVTPRGSDSNAVESMRFWLYL